MDIEFTVLNKKLYFRSNWQNIYPFLLYIKYQTISFYCTQVSNREILLRKENEFSEEKSEKSFSILHR